jgi:phage baseplate assembly protein W
MPRLQPDHPDSPVFVDFPFHIDWKGTAATTSRQKHVRNLLEQLLFTSPGERINRPLFGCGLDQALFRPNSEILAETARVTTEASIQQWLGHLIRLESLSIVAAENVLTVQVSYHLLNDGETNTATFERPL